MKQLSGTAKHNLALLAIGLGALFIVVVAVLAVSPRNVMSGPVGATGVPIASAGNYAPQNEHVTDLELPLVQLEGTWQYKKDGTAFTATVTGRDIKIAWITGEDTTATYWHGTFETAESPGHTITSTKTEASDEIVMSQSTTKDFAIGEDSITFDFSAMGFTTKVVMHR